MPDPRICFWCGGEITSKDGKKFCSIKCSAAYANTFAAAATRKDKSRTCEECGKIFERKDRQSRFCSHSCSAKFHNRPRSEAARHKCAGCESSILLRVEYCSPKCKTDHKIRLWLAGEFNATKAHSISKFIREYVLEKAEYACVECGYANRRDDGASILQVHHIDGNWQNNCSENLECLCPNCHALTENYGARNKGKGRTWKQDYNQFASVAKR